ncbi:hypothetical protein [Flagellimonas sp.]|uniref:hypothetical protein n=1 Tax=Flagellimonas sp. TaxID=2058762 RepID=UPI003BA865AE
MRKQNRNKTIFVLLILALGLWGFKKKAPGVEVGQGEFGEPGTDGDLEEEQFDSVSMKAGVSSILPTSSWPSRMDDSRVRPRADIYNKHESGCNACA